MSWLIRARGQHEDDAHAAVARKARRRRIGEVAELLNDGVDTLDGALAHPGAALQHAVRSCEADTRLPCGVVPAGACGGVHTEARS